MSDAIFENPRLAQSMTLSIPTALISKHIVAMTSEFSAKSVLDIGCGTGTWPASWLCEAST